MADRSATRRRNPHTQELPNEGRSAGSRRGAAPKPSSADGSQKAQKAAEAIKAATGYRPQIKRAIIKHAGWVEVGQISATHVAKACEEWKAHKPSTRRAAHSKLRCLLREIGAPASAAGGVPHVPSTRPKEKIVTEMEYEMTLRQARMPVKLAMLLAREAGLRIGTILQFSTSNCNFETRTISGRTKRHASYTIPMTQRLYDQLIWCASNAADQYEPLLAQFHPGTRQTYAYCSINNALRATQKAAGSGGGWSFHDLRRTAARHLYEATKDIRKVQRLLAHSNPWHTFWYLGTAGVDLTHEEIEQVHTKTEKERKRA